MRFIGSGVHLLLSFVPLLMRRCVTNFDAWTRGAEAHAQETSDANYCLSPGQSLKVSDSTDLPMFTFHQV